MITKETFCKALQMIHEQEEINRKVSESLTMIGDGYFIYGPKNKFLEALLMGLANRQGHHPGVALHAALVTLVDDKL